ncbi:MAG: LCP family protein [Acidimicrobiales bacterium]
MLLAVGLFSTLSLVTTAAALAWGLQRYQAINFLRVPNVEKAPPGDPTNWLLVGSDSREGIDPNDPRADVLVGEVVTGKRTDTIMVARIDPQLRTIDLLSIPRDLWVPLAGTGENGRINSAFNGDGGEERLVSTVEDVLDIEINHYAEVNFVGFQEIIDALGGVSIWFDTPVRDLGSGLDIANPGCHSLSGSDALAFARSRKLEYRDADGNWKADPTGDLGRNARQQYLLSLLADTANSRLNITDLLTVDRILQAGGRNLVLDDGASAGSLVELARTFASVGAAGISSHSLPVTDFRTSGGAAVLDLDEDAAQPTLDLFRGGRPIDETVPPSEDSVDPGSFTVAVQNGARITGLAAETSAELTASGFDVGGVADASETVDVTTILYPSGQEAAAATLGRAIPVDPLYHRDDTVTSIVLVVGPDRAGYGGADASAETTTTAPPPTPPVETTVIGVVPGPAPEGSACA